MIEIKEGTHAIGLDYYSLTDLGRLAEEKPKLTLSSDVVEKIEAGSNFVAKKAAEDRYIYGVNTGFGSLCETRVEAGEMKTLQFNHVTSHAVGVGEIVPERISRLTFLVKLLTFRSGRTGISLACVQKFLDFWNRGIIPAIPKKGSVGASGDLAPLAHMGLPVLGLGQVHYKGELIDAQTALKAEDISPIELGPKEGLAITNGVQYINANAVDCLLDLRELIVGGDVVASLSIQGFSASRTFYQKAYQDTSYHPERGTVAANLRLLLEGSNHFALDTCNKSMQDPYSFRCMPQVHAGIRQTYGFAADIVEKECNSVSDNPLFFPEIDEVLFGGALHGESTAMFLDYTAIAASELASISERRTWQLQSGTRGLPDFLVERPGLNSGLMITQYTSAALVNENKVFATPASVDTIATCQMQEDHVSMGATSAYKLRTILDNCAYVLAIELLNAAQAIDLNRDLKLSEKTASVHSAFRERVSKLESDRVLSTDIEIARNFILEQKGIWFNEFGLQ